ncbi:MAG: hypothetical protein R3C10_24270 [Pirellulales bacterium]
MKRRVDVHQERRKRELRQRLARSRRRFDADARQFSRSAREQLSWRTQVSRHPLAAIGAAAGVGLIVALLPRAGRLAYGAAAPLGFGWLRRVVGFASMRLIAQLLRDWRNTTAMNAAAAAAPSDPTAAEVTQ